MNTIAWIAVCSLVLDFIILRVSDILRKVKKQSPNQVFVATIATVVSVATQVWALCHLFMVRP